MRSENFVTKPSYTANKSKIITKFTSNEFWVVKNSKNAKFGRLLCRTAKMFTNSIEDRDAIYCMPSKHMEPSFVSSVRMLSKKSVTAFGAKPFKFFEYTSRYKIFSENGGDTTCSRNILWLQIFLHDLMFQVTRNIIMNLSLKYQKSQKRQYGICHRTFIYILMTHYCFYPKVQSLVSLFRPALKNV